MATFDGNFRRLGSFDIPELKKKVLALTEADWNASTWRQERFEVHKDTQTIALIFDMDYRHENPTKHEMYFELDCERLLAPFAKTIADSFTGSGYIVRAILIRLKPGGVIDKHVDAGPSLTTGRRIHVPIVSNDRCVFAVGGDAINMGEGEMWEINNTRIHSVWNAGDEGRVHLVIDWVVT
jgi:hypothetical protein